MRSKPLKAAGDGRGEAGAFPWTAALHAGLHLLRLDPTLFWRLTPIEFAAMTGRLAPRAARFERQALNALMHAYPDQ